MPELINDIKDILKDPNHCPFCNSYSVEVSRSTKQTIGKKIGINRAISGERSSSTESEILDKRLICRCPNCNSKYYNHGFNSLNVRFFDNSFILTNNQPEYSLMIRNAYQEQNLQNIIEDILWDEGALLCQIHNKHWLFNRNQSEPYHFFVISNINEEFNILKMTTDLVTTNSTGWGTLHLINLDIMQKIRRWNER